jgi:hypothetical protein
MIILKNTTSIDIDTELYDRVAYEAKNQYLTTNEFIVDPLTKPAEKSGI